MHLPDTRTVGRWENGKTFPHPHYVQELCRAFGKSAEELGLLKRLSRQSAQEGVSQMDRYEVSPLWNVPSSFAPCIGRTQEIAAICSRLKQVGMRWLTVLGPGGIGKTCLVADVANEMREYFADGICFVSCAALPDSSLVLYAIAQELGIQENGEKTLLECIRSFLLTKDFLLILDSFEQVTGAVSLVEELLATCSRLKVLATSRIALRLQTEHEFPLDPLSLPPADVPAESETLLSSAAVALFVQRAQALLPAFQITQTNAQDIAEICQHLDGLPLAIELAAALLKIFPPRVLLAKIVQQRFDVLKGEHRQRAMRQQTLYDTIKWSYDLLNAEEQWLFRQMAVFVGGCSLEAIEMLCRLYKQQALDVLGILKSFVDKSLIQRQSQEEMFPYFTMLETVREFGMDRLRIEEEWETSQQTHAAYYLALAEQAEPHLKGAAQGEWVARFEREKENLRATLTWLLNQSQTEQALRFCDAFGKFCGLQGYWSEERHWLDLVLEQAQVAQRTPALARVLRRAGSMAYRLRDLEKARALLEQSVRLSRETGDQSNLAGALSGLGWVLYKQKEIAASERLLQESVKVARSSGDRWSLANTLESLGKLKHLQGSLDEAYSLMGESIILAREVADKENLARLLCALVTIDISRGENEQAEQSAWESYALAMDTDNKPLIALALDGLASIAYLQGNYENAMELYERRLQMAYELDDRSTIASKKLTLGDIALKRNNLDLAEALVQESLTFFRPRADNPNVALAFCILGDIKREQKDLKRAIHCYRETFLLEQVIGARENTGRGLIGLARTLLERDLGEQAAGLLSFASTWLGDPGKSLSRSSARDYQKALERLHVLLDQETFASAWSNGGEMTYEDVLNLCDYYGENC